MESEDHCNSAQSTGETQSYNGPKFVQIGWLPKETNFISLEISKKEHDDLKALLRKYNHIIVWRYEQMLGVDPKLLAID